MAADRSILEIVKKTFKDFSEDECPQMAAALSYYTVFSLPPLLVLILLLVGLFLEPQQVQEALSGQMGALLGPDGRAQITEIFQNAERPDVSKGAAGLLGFGALIFGATGAVGQLQSALNKAWEVKPDPSQGGWKNFVFKRLLSFGMILGIAFILLVSLAISAMLTAFGDVLGAMGGISGPLLHLINLAISLLVITGLFAAMFKVLPDAEVSWKDVAIGGLVTTVLFLIGKFAIGLYLGRSDPGAAFGAAGSLAILLVWIYYSSMILLLGAEFTQTWAERRGGGVRPEPGAVRVDGA